jgi:diguanylate cyclase (GGDEF)-like protein/PAS domain S-box-containing protein
VRTEGLSDEAVMRTLDAAPDAVLVFTAAGAMVYANDAAMSVFERTHEELLSTTIAELLHPDDVGVAAASANAFEVQGPRSRTPAMLRFLRPDGGFVTLEVNGNPVTTEGGGRLYSMFARRGEEQQIMGETIRTLAQDYDLRTVLNLIVEQMRWGVDHALAVLVWQDEADERERVGDDVPAELCGLADDDRHEDSPWVRAWKGEDGAGAAADLPTDLRRTAEGHGLSTFRVHPVADEVGRVRAVITAWDDQRGFPLPVFENRLMFISGLLQLALRFDSQQRMLRHDANHDALTGLANRRAFFAGLHESTARGPTDRTAVLYIDLDGFKPINDEHGHGGGDLLLMEVAQRLRRACRSDDIVARLGGDEFAVMCRSTDTAAVTAVAERFLAELARPIDVGGVTVTVRASVGAAVGPPSAAERLAIDADRALYEAKRAGGQRLVVAAPAP